MSENRPQAPNRKLRSLLVDPKMLGASLRPVSSELIQSDGSDLVGLWLHSDRDLDFFVWRDENKTIIKQQLCFMGIIAEWNIIEGARTGVVFDDERATAGVRASSVVKYDDEIQKMVLDQASQICANISSLTQAERRECAGLWGSVRGMGVHTTFTDFVKDNYLTAMKPTAQKPDAPKNSNWVKLTKRIIGFFRRFK